MKKLTISAGNLCKCVITTHHICYHVHGHKAVALRGVGYVASLGYHTLGYLRALQCLGVGPSVSYTQAKQDYSELIKGAGYKFSSVIVEAKGYVHYNLFKVDELDTYVALTLGWNVASAKPYGWGEHNDFMKIDPEGGMYYAFAVSARYWFTDAIGDNLEAGYGMSFLKAGVTFKF